MSMSNAHPFCAPGKQVDETQATKQTGQEEPTRVVKVDSKPATKEFSVHSSVPGQFPGAPQSAGKSKNKCCNVM